MEGVRLIEVYKNAQCLLTINFQRLLYTVIKFHVKEAKEAVLYFVQDFFSAGYRSNLHLIDG